MSGMNDDIRLGLPTPPECSEIVSHPSDHMAAQVGRIGMGGVVGRQLTEVAEGLAGFSKPSKELGDSTWEQQKWRAHVAIGAITTGASFIGATFENIKVTLLYPFKADM